jgi:hypothetical protein
MQLCLSMSLDLMPSVDLERAADVERQLVPGDLSSAVGGD